MELHEILDPPSHLRIYRRDHSYVVYNPTAPTWIHTNAVGAIILKLMDGERTVGEIVALCNQNGVECESALAFIREANASGIFTVHPPSRRWEKMEWRKRRLTAIYLHMTNKCNLECSYCYRGSSPRIPTRHKGEDFIDFFKQARPLLTEKTVVTFSGGEPMLHPDLFLVAQHCKDAGMSNSLLTNGSFIDRQNVERVADLFSYVKISLDGASEDTHARTRGEDNFSKVVSAINLLSELDKTRVEVQMTVNTDNLAECENIKTIMPFNIKVKFTPSMPMGRGKSEKESQISNEAFTAVNRRINSGRPDSSAKPRNLRSFGCHAGISNISISDRGDVYPCHLFHSNQFKLGNIFRDSIDDIFFSDKNYQFSSEMDVENNNIRCSSCDFRYLCGGGCKANPLHAHGDFRKSDTYCEFIREGLVDGFFAELRDAN